MGSEERVRERRDLSKKEIAKIEDSYYPLKIKDFRLLSGGMRSNTVELRTSEGAKVLKVYPGNFDKELIDYHSMISNYLNWNGVPAPEVFPNGDFDLATPLGDTHCTLMDYLPGVPPSNNGRRIGEYVFGSLAKVTQVLSKYPWKKDIVAPELRAPLDSQVSGLLDTIEGLGESRVDSFVWEYRDRLREVSESVWKPYRDYRRQVIIGDFNLGSVLVDKGEVSGVIDFDMVHNQGTGFDFMHSFDLLYVDRSEGEVSLEGRVDWEGLKRSIGIYSEIFPEVSEDIETFPMMYKILGLRNLVDVWGNFYSGDADGEFFRDRRLSYIPRLEIPMILGDRIVETLEEGIKQ